MEASWYQLFYALCDLLLSLRDLIFSFFTILDTILRVEKFLNIDCNLKLETLPQIHPCHVSSIIWGLSVRVS
jgi:hypothetical protein